MPKAERPVPRDIPVEPPQTKEKRVTLQEPWPLPAVVVAYHVIKDGNPDSYPLHIAAKVLSDGQTSRIHRKLVYEKQMAVAAFGNANLIEDPNLFYAVAIVSPGHTTDEVTAALIAELDRLKAEPITDRELQRTKNQFARDYIMGRESNQQKALQLSHAVVIHGEEDAAIDPASDPGSARGPPSGDWDITLADISPAMLRNARVAAAERGLHVETVQHTAESMPFANASFDVTVSQLVVKWDDALADRIAAENLFLDQSKDRRRAAIAELRSRVGACTPPKDFDYVENALRGRWTLTCERGNLQVAITLAPTMPPKVQLMGIRPAMPVTMENCQ